MHYLRIFSLVASLLLALAALPPAPGRAAVSLPEDGSQLDPVSAGCISCHDGSDGPHAGFCLLVEKIQGCNYHIVSVSYAKVTTGNKGFRPAGSLPPELVLHEGKITCVTCHGSDAHAGDPLAIDNRDSALCLACHLMGPRS